MYSIGDKIVYPMHGAGVIESIEEREILGEKQDYYVLRMPARDMKVMIPINNVTLAGIREVADEAIFDNVIELFQKEMALDSTTANWNKRYRENMIKIRGGDILEVADVVKSLMLRDNQKGLSTGEKKMLSSARQILISELVLAKNIPQEEVEKMICQFLEAE